MLRAILFDMGGTLDGDGHWLDRYVALYARHGLTLPRAAIRSGFDYAEQRAAADETIVTADLTTLVRRHLAWQFELHGIEDATLYESIALGFLRPVRDSAIRNRTLLAGLQRHGFRLGVISNACGNVQVLCDDLGYSPYLSVVVDSRVVGVAKPDPAIYELALERLGVEAAAAMMVGDSYERDIVPPHRLGMRTAWLTHGTPGGEPGVADVCLSRLDDLGPYATRTERASA